ncbi:MAG: hypothetical protein Q9169_007197 [Polycauliona sp. 2 TL-2023]
MLPWTFIDELALPVSCRLLSLAYTAPDRNLTALHTEYAPSFVPEPGGRGTWSLLYSCIFTLALCVWTAIHPNLPNLGTSQTQKYRFKALWVLVAIFAPEVGVLTAFKQYRKATTFAVELSRIRDEHALRAREKSIPDPQDLEGQKSPRVDHHASADTNTTAPAPPFSKTYGFYVLMGGLSINVSHLHDRLSHVYLLPNGVLELARKGHFFHVSDADINDKSKANWLAKGLVFLQITWTVLQCLSRKIVGLPLSILEVHILVHAGCALIMYVLWFNKPLDVDQPILITNGIPDEITALMLVQNYQFGEYPEGNLLAPSGFEPARRSRSEYGIWPSGQASESTFLVFNPNVRGDPGEKPASLKHDDELERRNSRPQLNPTLHAPIPAKINDASANDPSTNLCTTRVEQSASMYLMREISRAHSNPSIVASAGTRPDPSESAQYDISINQRAINQDNRRFVSADGSQSSQAGYLNGTTCTTPQTDDEEFSIFSKALPGTEDNITLSISTGDFLSGGIGPNAYPLGEWRNDLVNRIRPPYTQPSKIKQIPPHLLEKLPLQHINHSSVKYYCPITLSLSPIDILRWQLAASALQKELPVTSSSSSPPAAQQDLPIQNIDSAGSTCRGAYFANEQLLLGIKAVYVDEVYNTYWHTPRNYRQHIIGLRRFYNNCLEVEELKLGATSAVTMLPGLMYGALHLALWEYGFPTRVEGILWKVAGVVLIVVPVSVAGLLALRGGRKKYVAKRKARQARLGSNAAGMTAGGYRVSRAEEIGKAKENNADTIVALGSKDDIPIHHILLLDTALFSVALIGMLYIFSRVFIIVESFISLRHVPTGVYAEVGWNKYIPHL